MEANTYEANKLFSNNTRNSNIMCMGGTILDAASEAGIDENWFLLDNQSM